MPRWSSRRSGCFALAQGLGRSLEAGVPRTVRVKPSEIGFLFLQQRNHNTCRRRVHVSEWVAHRRGSNSSSTTRPNARPHRITDAARPRRPDDRPVGRDLPSLYFIFSKNCAVQRNLLGD
jgi:hypothetical protein